MRDASIKHVFLYQGNVLRVMLAISDHSVTFRAAYYVRQVDALCNLGNAMDARIQPCTVTFATFHAVLIARTANVTKTANARQAVLLTTTVQDVSQNALTFAIPPRPVLSATSTEVVDTAVFRDLQGMTVKQVYVFFETILYIVKIMKCVITLIYLIFS